MAGVNICNTCNRNVLRHSLHMICCNCLCWVHLNCLPRVSKTDSIYINRDTSNWYCTKCIERLFPYNQIFDDTDFINAISENWDLQKTISFDIINNQEKIFLPFELNESESHPLSDIDPDVQYYNDQFNTVLNSCDYYFEESCNQRIKTEEIKHNSFSLLHANIRSASKNLRNFETYLENIEHKFKPRY